MPALIPIVVAAVSAIAFSSVQGALLAAGFAGWIAALGGAAVAAAAGTLWSIGLNYAFGTNKKKSRANETQASQAQDTKVLVRSSVEPRRVIYGQARVSGPILYAFSSGPDSDELSLIIALAGHRVQVIGSVWINDDEIPVSAMGGPDGVDVVSGKYANKVVIVRKLGDQTTADAGIGNLSPDGWGADHILRGIAYLYVRLKFDRNLFQGGVPNISALVTGKADILDPRTNATGYSNNWALCVLDYLRSDVGLACAADEIDVASFIAAANLSDENVPLNAGGSLTQKRYTVDGTFTLDRAPIEIMEDLLDAGGGALVYVQGQYRLHGGAYSAPTATLGISDFAGPVKVSTRAGKADLFNRVRGAFIDPSRFWQAAEFQPVTSSTHEAEDGEPIWRDVEMPFVIDNTRAQRLARQLLLRSRRAVTIDAPLRYASLRLSVWDTVSVTIPYLGYSAKPFRIVAYSYNPADGTISVTMREDDPASYAWLYDDADPAGPVPGTTLVSPLNIPAPLITAINPATALQGDGTYIGALEVLFTSAAHPFLTGHEVQWRRVGTQAWDSLEVPAGTTRALLSPVVVGQSYEVRARGVGTLARGAWSGVASGLGAVDTTAPAVPTGATATGTLRAVSLSWSPPADLDLAAVEVWENTTNNSATRYYVGEGRAGFLRGGLATATTYWYWLRSRDRTGNVSAFVGPVSATTSQLLANDIANGIVNTAKLAASIQPVEFGTALPSTGNFEGRYFYIQPANPADAGTLHRFVGGVWVTTEGGQPVAFPQVIAGSVRAAAISTRELAAGAVRATNVASEEIITQTLQVKDLIVGTSKISFDGVTSMTGQTAWRDDTLTTQQGFGYQRIVLCSGTITVGSADQQRVLILPRVPPVIAQPVNPSGGSLSG
jgi:hypothetical protein